MDQGAVASLLASRIPELLQTQAMAAWLARWFSLKTMLLSMREMSYLCMCPPLQASGNLHFELT